MSKYQFTPQASDDLIDIWSFIARDDFDAAERVESAIFQACELLSKSPLAGQIRKDLTSLPLRFWLVHPYRNYFIVYNPESKPVQIIRIIHGTRDLPSVLK
jgi:antitoxin ParD1/3/4